jgi:uncharacterized membrane protein (UPF0127 family)
MVLVNKTSIYYVIFILAIGAALLGLLFLRSMSVHGAVLHAGTVDIPVTIADTVQSRARGLSGTPSLPSNVGMLFVYGSSDKYGFWMKDMHYPLDLVWIDEDFKIVDIAANVSPDTYPHVFYPAVSARYVLEMNGGFSTIHSLVVGQSVLLTEN